MTFTQTRLKKSVIKEIDTPEKRMQILMETGFKPGDNSLHAHLVANKAGGWLTRIDVLKAISKVTGKKIDDLIEVVVKSDKSFITPQM